MSRANGIFVSRGFSTIEVLVVILLVLLLASVSIPFYGKLRRRSELRAVAMEIGTTLIAARMKAVRYNSTVRVIASPPGSSDPGPTLTSFRGNPLPTPVPNSMNTIRMPGKAMRFVTTPTGGWIDFDGNGRRVAPAGTSDGMIVIEGPLGSTAKNQITIDVSAGGRVRIVTPTVWQ
jgi:Tfp pilus assembly protein FimT